MKKYMDKVICNACSQDQYVETAQESCNYCGLDGYLMDLEHDVLVWNDGKSEIKVIEEGEKVT